MRATWRSTGVGVVGSEDVADELVAVLAQADADGPVGPVDDEGQVHVVD